MIGSNTFIGNSTAPLDYRILQGCGSLIMHPGDSTTDYLEYAIGNSLSGLQNGIQDAFQKFQTITNVESRRIIQLPKTYKLYQNYPNPFNPSTTIEFNLPKTSNVALRIFNILGEEVATLVSDSQTAGSYSYVWDASDLASGIYLYRLQAGEFVETKKMILMR